MPKDTVPKDTVPKDTVPIPTTVRTTRSKRTKSPAKKQPSKRRVPGKEPSLEPVQPETVEPETENKQPQQQRNEESSEDGSNEEVIAPVNVFDREKKEYDSIQSSIPTIKESDLTTPESKALTLQSILEDIDVGEQGLYPDLNDPLFSVKIAQRGEFFNNQIIGKVEDVTTQSAIDCTAPFEILPNQQFAKNFLSPHTPYNSLLLYNELGTGKTCSAIGITEQVRALNRQSGTTTGRARLDDESAGARKILIVASPNVQDNFRLQLFDPAKLVEVGGPGSNIWDINSCVGNQILAEINPTSTTAQLTREYITMRAKQIIDNAYEFVGYTALSLRILSIADIPNLIEKRKLDNTEIQRLRAAFDGRLMVIDEVHNIIGKEEESRELKKISALMYKLVKYCSIKLLFLSATPMYNSYKEIIWLVNIMNVNDRRAVIQPGQVFDSSGNFIEPQVDNTDPARPITLVEGGRDLLKRKLTGYVSYVRGENPYVFPYRIYPDLFAPVDKQITPETYPKYQLNRRPITDPIRQLKVYVSGIGSYQRKVYRECIKRLHETHDDFESRESFGYITIQAPLGFLNMTYPSEEFDEFMAPTQSSVSQSSQSSVSQSTQSSVSQSSQSPAQQPRSKLDSILNTMRGSSGLKRIMTYDQNTTTGHISNFRYNKTAYGEIFKPSEIGKYSAKIAEICDLVRNSEGIVLIYSKYIDGGLVPMALALEEMGLTRYQHSSNPNGPSSLFRTPPTAPLDALTMLPGAVESPARYAMITGSRFYSHSNVSDLAVCTSKENIRGQLIKCILISDAGAEGVDFRMLRRVHVIDPWYNINHIEQIIGRAVRNKSHCWLPLSDRNVEIYLHCTSLRKTESESESSQVEEQEQEQEAIDMYMYRLAEKKAITQGAVTRLLKEISVDCLLNINQTNYTEANMNQTIRLRLSTRGKEIDYRIGDKPYTSICDFMANCEYSCNVPAQLSELYPKTRDLLTAIEPDIQSYNYQYLQTNYARIAKRIRELYRESTFYTLEQLRREINLRKPFPIEHIYYTITVFLQNHSEWLVNNKGRRGYLVYRRNETEPANSIYVFQPIDVSDPYASIYDRTAIIPARNKTIPILLPDNVVDDSLVPQTVPNKQVAIQEKPQSAQRQPSMQESVRPRLSAPEQLVEIQTQINQITATRPNRKDAFEHIRVAMDLVNRYFKIDAVHCLKYFIHRNIDTMDLPLKLDLLRLVSNKTTTEIPANVPANVTLVLVQTIQKYFEDRTVDQSSTSNKTVVLADTVQTSSGADTGTAAIGTTLGNNHVFVYKQASSSWIEMSMDEAMEHPRIKRYLEITVGTAVNNKLLKDLNDAKERIKRDANKTSYHIGYYGLFKHEVILKARNLLGSRVVAGAALHLEGKGFVLARINDICDQVNIKKPPPTYMQDAVKPVTAIVYELICRYFTEQGFLLFLTREQTVGSKIDQFIVATETIAGITQYVREVRNEPVAKKKPAKAKN